jgi:hypothetical protein
VRGRQPGAARACGAFSREPLVPLASLPLCFLERRTATRHHRGGPHVDPEGKRHGEYHSRAQEKPITPEYIAGGGWEGHQERCRGEAAGRADGESGGNLVLPLSQLVGENTRQHWHMAVVSVHKMIDASRGESASHSMAHGHTVGLTVAENTLRAIGQGAQGEYGEGKAHRIGGLGSLSRNEPGRGQYGRARGESPDVIAGGLAPSPAQTA